MFFQWINENIGFCANSGRVFHTLDVGVTWKPQLFTDTLVKRIDNIQNMFFDDEGNGIIITNHNSIRLSDSTKDLNYMFTKDFGQTFQRGLDNDFFNWLGKYRIQTLKIDNKYLSYCSPMYWTVTVFKLFDSNFDLINDFSLKKYNLIKIWESNDLNTLIAFGRNSFDMGNNTGEQDSIKIYFFKSDNFGEFWEIFDSIKVKGEFPYPDFYKDNEIIFRTQKNKSKIWNFYFYYYNLQTKELNNFYNYNDSLQLSYDFSKIDSFFIFSDFKYQQELKMENIGETNFSIEEIQLTKYYYPGLTFYSDFEKLSYGISYDPIYAVKYGVKYIRGYKIKTLKLKKRFKTNIKWNTNISSYSFFTKPYPNPTKNEINIVFYSENLKELGNNNISVYDIHGNKINSFKSPYLEKIDNYKGLIKWNCENLQPGIYFIVLNSQNIKKCIKFIKE